ncbi:monovalent cation/H+ antiporter complex subunit F [Allonocardiopsis opalescens]|uniref:Multisubunit sodium/proton antiporter MrpF subunit n=1 Tax=Allonocardiopsis opalescens TaxID=1144618 RepID=A0A2T0Q0L6_9ACTN|nr:monovalent cation/H+ antiporter complex subunit F [Allonocardiopsis opalescens]PRX97337.1 multisubunit sodium/proton antiporter MrpF subunit [Allonocardiopsis opalescens]
MSVVYAATLAMLALAGLAALVRMVRGPSVLDRIVALNAMSIVLVSAVAVEGAMRGGSVFVAVMVSVALIGFLGALTAARFAERRAARERR